MLRGLHTLKDCGKTLTNVTAVALLSLLSLSSGCGVGENQRHNVAISVVGSTVQSESNIMTFLITNAFEFPIRYAASAATKDATQNWRPVYSKGLSITLVRGQIPARGTTTFTWALPPTNRWRIEVPYNDPRHSLLRKRIQGVIWSSEMVGGSLVPPEK
jgi:hypothetical protein